MNHADIQATPIREAKGRRNGRIGHRVADFFSLLLRLDRNVQGGHGRAVALNRGTKWVPDGGDQRLYPGRRDDGSKLAIE
jgi:hypothetical protein